eukprot:c22894_g1_i1 orf=269-2953(+)
MSGPKAASKAAGGGSAIPAGDRKLISTVKEVAPGHTEDEIYAMLKECNRDPNEAVARLLNEAKFHVVKRKREKKKETGTTKDASDSRQGSSGNFGRGGRSTGTSGGRGPGRGTPSLRTTNNAEGSGGRSKNPAQKENGIPSFVKTPSTTLGGSLSYSQLVQPKASFNYALNNGLPTSSGLSNGDTLQETVLPGREGGWPASSGFGTTSATPLQGAWLAGSGHGTIADMLKGGARKSSVDVVPSAVPASATLEQQSVYSAALDPVASLPYDSHTRSPQRFSGDVSSFGFQDGDSAHYGLASNSSALSVERDVALSQPSDPTLSVSLEEQVQSASGFTGGQSRTLGIADIQDGQGSQFSGAPVYQAQQFAESQRDSTSVDWSSHLMTHEEAPPHEVLSEGVVPDGPPSPPSISATAAKLQEMSVRDSHSVIIPDHIRVSESDCTMLSFGSFDVGFDGQSPNPSFVSESKNHSFSVSEDAAVNDLEVAMRSLSTSMPTSAILDHEQPISSVSVQNLHSSADVNVIGDETVIKEEEDLPEEPAQHEYPPSYSGMSTVSSDHTSHYAAASEETDSRPRDVSTVPPPYDNSTYYSGVFRSVPELDSRYSAFSQLAASGKLGTSRPAETTVQSVSQEVVNASVYPSSNTVGGQTMPAVNNGPSAMTLPQHSLHPYATQPSGLPLGHYANVLNYQYMPPGFSYVQSPYQHNYVGTGNYHQVPTAVGAGGMKYPVPQYKTSGPVVGGMHNTISPSSLGYGGYPNTQPAANLPATSGNTSTFDDPASQLYKDNMYMSSQQIDGPSVWLQSQLAREAQGSSYYNVPSQNQPTRYSQTQSLLTHAHPAAVYGNLYHQQQSGSSPSAHQQLLQQQQAMGSVGALGTQNGSYQQQNQRAQPTWAPGPY